MDDSIFERLVNNHGERIAVLETRTKYLEESLSRVEEKIDELPNRFGGIIEEKLKLCKALNKCDEKPADAAWMTIYGSEVGGKSVVAGLLGIVGVIATYFGVR